MLRAFEPAPRRLGRAPLIALALAACAPSHPDYFGTVAPRHGPDEVWVNNGNEPQWIDPTRCADSAGGTVAFNLFAGLTQPHPVTLEPMPDIARRWDVSGDGRVYTFHLRPSSWSDGTPVTAGDFEYSWKRVLDPETRSAYASFLFVVENGAAVNQRALVVTGLGALGEAGASSEALRRALDTAKGDGTIEKIELQQGHDRALVWVTADDREAARDELAAALARRAPGARVEVATTDLAGVRALDDRTLEVTLEEPIPYFLAICMYYTALPVPRHVIERLRAEGTNPDLWTRVENIVTNGAYRLTEWKFRQSMVFEKNAEYWDAANVRMPTVRMLMVQSYTTTLAFYEAGELDYIGANMTLPAELLDAMSTYRDFRRYPYLGNYFFWLNTKKPPLDDVRVRRALNLAVDRAAITRFVTRGGQTPTADLVPDDLAGYQGLDNPLFDPEGARRLLAEAGYPGGERFPAITLLYNTGENHQKIAEAVQQMWKRELGIDVELENQEWRVFLESVAAGSFHVARYGWIGDYADPYTFLELLTSHNGNNSSGFADPVYDDLLAQANRTVEPAARLALLRQAEERLHAAAPILPFYIYTRAEMVKPYLRGHFANFQNRHAFKDWWIDRRWYDGVPADPGADSEPPRPKLEPAAVLDPSVVPPPEATP